MLGQVRITVSEEEPVNVVFHREAKSAFMIVPVYVRSSEFTISTIFGDGVVFLNDI